MTPDITREQLIEAMAKAIGSAFQSKAGWDEGCAKSALSAIEAIGLEINQAGTQAELELLEEVCAIYVSDEDRYLKDGGEAYGLIPTECGMKARTAARRFHEREAMLPARRRRRKVTNLTDEQKAVLKRCDKFGAIELPDNDICPGIHFCPDWDRLAVCIDSPEADGCSCGRLDDYRRGLAKNKII